MMHEIEFGISAAEIKHGHEPSTWQFTADAVVAIDGEYGINYDNGSRVRAYVTVDLPDEVTKSTKYRWDLAWPGRKSAHGSADLCFVVCNTPAVACHEHFGGLDAKALISQAIESGLRFVYPGEDGSMMSEPVACEGVRWVEL